MPPSQISLSQCSVHAHVFGSDGSGLRNFRTTTKQVRVVARGFKRSCACVRASSNSTTVRELEYVVTTAQGTAISMQWLMLWCFFIGRGRERAAHSRWKQPEFFIKCPAMVDHRVQVTTKAQPLGA